MEPLTPRFYVVARVVGSDGSFKRWSELLVHLCAVSATEPQGTTYYWGQDLDGEPNTLWGLEGYSHAVGFFLGHPASEVFKTQMAFVDTEKLLREDYDLHYYDAFGGFLKRDEDPERDSKTGFVAVYHFWAKDKELREAILGLLRSLASKTRNSTAGDAVQSCQVLRECNDETMATLWLRTRTENDYTAYRNWEVFQSIVSQSLGTGGTMVAKVELHKSQAFNGHIDQKPSAEQP